MIPHTPVFNARRTALVLIECQNEWLGPDALLQTVIEDRLQFTHAQTAAKSLLNKAREANIAVGHAGLRFQTGYPELGEKGFGLRGAIQHYGTFPEGGPGSDFAAGFEPEPKEFIVHGRVGSSAFAGSNLDHWLRNNEINTLILAGFALHVCVESTLRAGHDLGYSCYIAKDATAAFTTKQYEHVLSDIVPHFGRAVSNPEISSLIQSTKDAQQ